MKDGSKHIFLEDSSKNIFVDGSKKKKVKKKKLVEEKKVGRKKYQKYYIICFLIIFQICRLKKYIYIRFSDLFDFSFIFFKKSYFKVFCSFFKVMPYHQYFNEYRNMGMYDYLLNQENPLCASRIFIND